MSVKDEILYDFSLNLPRVVTGGNITIIDNVKRIVLFSDSEIIVHTGEKYIAAEGNSMTVKELREGRMLVEGELEQIRFFEAL
jgi:sporulation protein YqfC